MNYKIELNTDSVEARQLMEHVARDGEESCPMELIYKNGRNRTYRVMVDGKRAVLKCFKVPNAINSLVYVNLRKSKARRSYEYAKRLDEMGIGTPMPLAYAECRDGLRLRRSYYLCDYIDGQEVRCWERLPDASPMLKALARDMVRLHRKGVFHKDFSPGNILYTVTPDGNFRFYYIDLNRVKFGVHDSNVLMQNFRCINTDLYETRRLARYYAEAAGLDPGATEEQAETQLNKYLASKAMHNKLKSMLHL